MCFSLLWQKQQSFTIRNLELVCVFYGFSSNFHDHRSAVEEFSLFCGKNTSSHFSKLSPGMKAKDNEPFITDQVWQQSHLCYWNVGCSAGFTTLLGSAVRRDSVAMKLFAAHLHCEVRWLDCADSESIDTVQQNHTVWTQGETIFSFTINHLIHET